MYGIPPLGTNAFYEHMFAQQDKLAARLKEDLGPLYVPSATKNGEARAYWTYLAHGGSIDIYM